MIVCSNNPSYHHTSIPRLKPTDLDDLKNDSLVDIDVICHHKNQPPTLNLQPPTLNLQPPTLNLQPPTLNLQPLTTKKRLHTHFSGSFFFG